MLKNSDIKYYFVVCFVAFCLLIFLNSCINKKYKEVNGEWILNDFPQFIFNPLDDSWEPLPPPANICVLFFGKIGGGTHIGVFIYPNPENVKPEELMWQYLQNGSIDDRHIIINPQPFEDNGIYAECENNFTSLGAKVRAIEAFCIIPTTNHLIGFTFKSRIEVDAWDFRREKGLHVYDNLSRTNSEHEEFINFIKGFHEE